MERRDVTIGLDAGLEARPVAILVQVASQFASTIYLETEEKKVNAKSIMGMMSLGLGNGEVVTVVAEGKDDGEAVVKMEHYLKYEN